MAAKSSAMNSAPDQQFHTQIKYVNVKPSAALDRFVQDHLRSLFDRISLHPNRYSVSITIKANARNAESKVTSYEVDGTFRIIRFANLRAIKKMSDVHDAVNAVAKSLEKQIRRHSEKRERSRKTIGTSLKPVRKFKAEAYTHWAEPRPEV